MASLEPPPEQLSRLQHSNTAVTSVDVALLRHIARIARHCDQFSIDGRKRLGLSSWKDLRGDDWWVGLRFFFDHAFFQGRRDDVSEAFNEAAIKALESLLPPGMNLRESTTRMLAWSEAGWFRRENWNAGNNPVMQALTLKYDVQRGDKLKAYRAGKGHDREMVLDTLRFISEHPAARGRILNIAAYAASEVDSGKTSSVYRELRGIRQIGPKIAAFFLRELVTALELQPRVVASDYKYLQPVDTWVKRVADKLGIKSDDADLSKALVEACQHANVDPIRFNQGAWYLGARSFDVLLENLDRIE